jgi:hypothetical protein
MLKAEGVVATISGEELERVTVKGSAETSPRVMVPVSALPVVIEASGNAIVIASVPAGGEVYVNPPDSTPVKLPGSSIVTFTVPAEFAGVIAWIWLGPLTVTPVAEALPNKTRAPATKFAPLMVTAVPPAVGPMLGEMPLTVGAKAI